MASFSRLIAATPADLQTTTKRELQIGVLRSKFLRGPRRCTTKAGKQPSGSGIHFSSTKPMIIQFPPEVLEQILCYLEPIWLFQLEAACLEIGFILTNQRANKIWYKALPPLIFAEAEGFQDEERVAEAQERDLRSNPRPNVLVIEIGNDLVPSPISEATYIYEKVGDQQSVIVLPELKGLSGLCMNEDWAYDILHPASCPHYPLITSEIHPTRIRNLALGGPYQHALSYRRELLGRLHSRKRCYLCFDILNSVHRAARAVVDWGLFWCQPCLTRWTLSLDQIRRVPELDHLIFLTGEESLLYGHARSPGSSQWRPFVDDILRREIGLDYETTLAKQKYFQQLDASYNAFRHAGAGIHVTRLRLRHDFVRYAQALWNAGECGKLSKTAIQTARETFAPASKLPRLLFRPGDLDVRAVCLPIDSEMNWPDDLTAEIKGSRDVLRRGEKWKELMASQMLTQMVSCDYGYSTYIQAADNFHTQRIKQTMTADYALAEINRVSKPMPSAYAGSNHRFRRLETILSKLHIHRSSYSMVPHLTAYQLNIAKEYFRKIVFATCIGCPQTDMLALPRGLEGVIKHVRESHPSRYWKSDDWMIVG